MFDEVQNCRGTGQLQKRIEKKGNNVESKNAIEIRNLSKMYKLYNRPLDRLKDSLGLSRKKLYKSIMHLRMLVLILEKENALVLLEQTAPENPLF